MKQRLIDKSIFMWLWEAHMLQIRHSSLIAIRLTAVAMLCSSIILHIVTDILRQFETKRENFSLVLTDAARYYGSCLWLERH